MKKAALLFGAGVVCSLAVSIAPAKARPSLYAQRLPASQQVWALGLGRKTLGLLNDATARRTRRARLNTILLDVRKFDTRQWRRARRLQRRFHFRVLALPFASTRSVKAGEQQCATAHRRSAAKVCMLLADSLDSARRLSSSPEVDLVVVRVMRLPSSASLEQLSAAKARVIMLVGVGRSRSLGKRAWRAAIRRAAEEPMLDLAIAPNGPGRSGVLGRYLTLLGSTTFPPGAPTRLRIAAATATSLTLHWAGVRGAMRYRVYRDGRLKQSVMSTSASLRGLSCQTRYRLTVDAVAKTGLHSAKASLSVATGLCSSPPSPPSGSANLWLDPNGGSCTRQAVAGAYLDAQACASLQAASDNALSGDTINIVDGAYPGQELAGSKTLSFRAAGPGRPSFGQFVTSASNVTIAGVLIENRSPQPTPFCSSWVLDYTLFVCGPNSVFENVIVDGLRHGSGDPERRGGIELSSSATSFVFRDGEIRSVRDSKGFQGGADNMLLEHNSWHDIALTPPGAAAGVHNECAYITEGDNQIWRRNRFVLCPVMAMFFANFIGGAPFSGVTVENNLFTHTLNDDGSWHDGSSFVIPSGAGGQNRVDNWIVRYNSFEVPPDIANVPGSALFYGNLGADPDCDLSAWTLSFNVGSTCGRPGERSVANAVNTRANPNQAPFYVNALTQDFHLKAGANPAVDVGLPAFPTLDLDGGGRPFGGLVDAGAYERR